MKRLLILATATLFAIAAHADTLADLGAGLFFGPGAKLSVPVLGPGIKLNIGGRVFEKVVAVVGDDICPNESGRSGCTIVDKPVVTVHWADGGKQVTEQWRVVKNGGRILLARPDGTLVSQAE